jgi:hypothetical protein
MYKSSLRHIHDPVLSSLKMKGILSFLFVCVCMCMCARARVCKQILTFGVCVYEPWISSEVMCGRWQPCVSCSYSHAVEVGSAVLITFLLGSTGIAWRQWIVLFTLAYFVINIDSFLHVTLYRVSHSLPNPAFLSNSDTNKDIATKFAQQYVLFFHISYAMR